MEVVKRRASKREEVINRAKEFAASLTGKFSVFLVGSYARGDFNAWSDVDLVVIGEFRGSPLKRIQAIEAPPGFEVIPLTPGEALAAARKKNPLIQELVEKGVVLRDDLGIQAKLREDLHARATRA
ncbi:MAG: nucleotidyltransferase domain-containing protein [Infirmifilum sp.]